MSDDMRIPLFLSLTEKKGESTSRLVETVEEMASDMGIDQLVELHSIKTKLGDRGHNLLDYSIFIDTADHQRMDRIFLFLNKVFETLYDNYPCYVDVPVDVVAAKSRGRSELKSR
jgi:hypothetical protein